MIQVCPKCNTELQKAKKTISGYLVWVIDHYEPVDTEVFISCSNCGAYLHNEDFE